MPTFTKMKQIDLKLFSTALQQSYSALFGSPAANACLEASKKIKNCYKYWSTDQIPVNEEEWEETDYTFKAEAMNEMLPEEERVEHPTLFQYDYKLPYISEERIQELGVDEDVDKALTLLRQDRDNHPEGTLKRMIIDFAIDGFEKFRRRELVAEATNPELLENPGADAIFKFANYTFIPKHGNGEGDDRVLPVDFPQDDKYDEDCTTRTDQILRGKYTEDQLNEALHITNLDNVYAANLTLAQAQRQVNNLLAHGNVDPARERIMKDNLLGAVDGLLAEYNRAIQTDLHDEGGLPLFDGNPEYMSDTLSPNGEGERSFSRDIASLQNYRNYLNSALPIAGFREIRELLLDLEVAKGQVEKLQNDGVLNHAPYAQAIQALETAVLNYPQDADHIDEWKNGIRTAKNNLIAAKDNLLQNMQFDQNSEETYNNNLQLRDHYTATRDHLIAERNNWPAGSNAYNNLTADVTDVNTKLNSLNTDIRNWETKKADAAAELQTGSSGKLFADLENIYLPDLDHLGQRTREEKNRYINDLMDGMQNDTRRMVNELKEFREYWFLGDRMKGALDNAIFRGAQDPLAGPDRFLATLKELKNVAGELHQQNPNNEKFTRIFNWAGKNAAYFESRVLEAKSKGILTSDSLKLQGQMREANGVYHMQEALNRFNTRRSSFFKLNPFNNSTEIGAESDEHKLLREKTQQLLAYKSLSSHFDKETDYNQWRASLETMQHLAKETYELAKAYVDKRGPGQETSAGRERYEGAVQIRDEAIKMFMDYKTQFSVENSYRSLNRATVSNQQLAADRVDMRTHRDELRAQQALAAAAGLQNNAGQVQNADNIAPDAAPQAEGVQVVNNNIQNDEPEAGNNQNINNGENLDEDDDIVNMGDLNDEPVHQANNQVPQEDHPINQEQNQVPQEEHPIHQEDNAPEQNINQIGEHGNRELNFDQLVSAENKNLNKNPKTVKLEDAIREAQKTMGEAKNDKEAFNDAAARILAANYYRINKNQKTIDAATFNKRAETIRNSKVFIRQIMSLNQDKVLEMATGAGGNDLWKDFASKYNYNHPKGAKLVEDMTLETGKKTTNMTNSK